MELPNAQQRKTYIESIKALEDEIKSAAEGDISDVALQSAQGELDKLAKKYQDDKAIGSARYKLYELQALIYYFDDKDDKAMEFINQAIESRGENYARADRIKMLVQNKKTKDKESTDNNKTIPFEFQALIKGLRSSAIVMTILSILSVYFIPWAIFYIVLAAKLDPKRVPSKGLIKAAAILTIPLCCGLIPIIIDLDFWRMNRRLKEYDEKGNEIFMSDKQWLEGEPKRKKDKKFILSVLISVLVLVFIFICYAVFQSGSGSDTNSSESLLLTNEQFTQYTSIEHGFKIDFPGFPETARDSIDANGYSIPYTTYTKYMDNGEIAYMVGVFDYSGIELNETGALEGAVNGAVQNTQDAVLISSEFSTYNGLNAIDAHYTAPIDGKTYDFYVKDIIKSGKMYSIISIGASKSDFDKYVGSLIFT